MVSLSLHLLMIDLALEMDLAPGLVAYLIGHDHRGHVGHDHRGHLGHDHRGHLGHSQQDDLGHDHWNDLGHDHRGHLGHDHQGHLSHSQQDDPGHLVDVPASVGVNLKTLRDRDVQNLIYM